jgi:hypothetical protein
MFVNCTILEKVNGEMQARSFIGGDFFPFVNVTMTSGLPLVRRLCIIIFPALVCGNAATFKPERNYDLIDANHNGVNTPLKLKVIQSD